MQLTLVLTARHTHTQETEVDACQFAHANRRHFHTYSYVHSMSHKCVEEVCRSIAAECFFSTLIAKYYGVL